MSFHTGFHLFAHYPITNPPDDRESLLSGWYKGYDSAVHEGWAQLLTYFVVSIGGDGIKNTFEKLLSKQSSDYHKYKDVLIICDDKNIILDSLIELRQQKKLVSFDDWIDIIKKIKGLTIK